MLVVAVWRMEKAVIGNVVTEKERSEVRVLFTVLLYCTVQFSGTGTKYGVRILTVRSH